MEPKTNLFLTELSSELSGEVQQLLFRYGFRWIDGRLEVSTHHKGLLASKHLIIDKGISWHDHDDISQVNTSTGISADNTTSIIAKHFSSTTVLRWVRQWAEDLGCYKITEPTPPTPEEKIVEKIAKKLEKEIVEEEKIEKSVTEQQHKDNKPTEPIIVMPPNDPMDPMKMMVEAITQQVLSRVPKPELDTTAIQKMIDDKVASIQPASVTIRIEDRRKSPAEIKELAEPVHCKMPDVVGVLKAGCWCCVVGPTGSGKTLGALQYAKMMGIKLVGIKQMTRIIAPHDLIGFMDAGGRYRSGAWTDCILGYHHDNSAGSIPDTDQPKDEPAELIVDEMDNSNENIVMLIKALQTGYIQMPYGLQKINPNLSVLATMNTWGTGATREYVGRMAQDAALLNEFSFVEWDYDTDFEEALLKSLFNSFKDTHHYKWDHMIKLHSMFKAMRGKADLQKVRVIISTRNIINTTKKLIENPGWPINKVLKMDVYKGLKDEEISRIECPDVWGVKPLKKDVATGGKKEIPF